MAAEDSAGLAAHAAMYTLNSIASAMSANGALRLSQRLSVPEIGEHCFAFSSFDHALDSSAWPFDPQYRERRPPSSCQARAGSRALLEVNTPSPVGVFCWRP